MRIVLVFLMLLAVSATGLGLLAASPGGGRPLLGGGPGPGEGPAAPSQGEAPGGAPPAAAAPGEPVTFTIQEGETTGAIAQRLTQLGLVRNALLFRLRVQWKGAEGRLQAGEYQLHRGMSEDALIETLQAAKARDVAITFVEGWRMEEFAEALEKADVGIDPQRFLELARRGTFTYDFLESRPAGASLEGYLFPDTYRVIPGKTTAEELIHQMLKRFGETLTPQLRAEATKNTGRSAHEVVILASVIEREAQVKEERPRISAVYHNRLRVKECLCADPTVQYAIAKPGDWWPPLRDLARNIAPTSPYNTYTNAGLPPGPISNPGGASLRAAAEPEKIDYLYFVRNDVKNDGSHVFARTQAEHDRNRAQYQRGS